MSFTRSRIFRLLLLSVVSVGLTLLVIEIIVRAVPLYPDRFYQYDETLGWRHIANMSGTYLYTTCLGDYRQPVTINAQGLHDVNHTYERQGDAYRVLLLGDSLVAGFEVPLETTFFRQASEQLNADGSSYEVIGGGHQGYTTGQELIFYQQEGRRYQPDMVILLVEPANDIVENNYMLRHNGSTYYPYYTLDEAGQPVFHPGDPTQIDPEHRPVNFIHDTLYDASRLYRLIYNRSAFLRGVTQVNQRTSENSESNTALEITAALLRELRDTVEADGVTFGVMIAPLNMTRPDTSTVAYEWLQALMAEENIPYRYPQAIFDSAPDSDTLFYPCDKYHWTPAGHALMGDVLADFVRDLRG